MQKLEEELADEKADHDNTDDKLMKIQEKLNEANEAISDLQQVGEKYARKTSLSSIL